MNGSSKAPKLSLKKETITKLSDDQMKKVIGGIGGGGSSSSTQSCDNTSCNSKGSGSCTSASCNCTPVTPGGS